MAQQSALDSFMQFYAAPAKPTPIPAESPAKSALRHSSYNLAPMSEEFSYEKSPMQSVASSPSPGSPASLRVSLPLENYLSSPGTITPRSSPYDSPVTPSSLPLKKSTSTPQIPSSVRFNGRESSDSTLSSFSNLSRSDSEATPGMERSNSFVVLSGDDYPQEVFIFDDYDDYDTEDSFSSEFDGDDSSPTSTSSRSDGPSPPHSVVAKTVRRKSTNARYFPTSEASLEKFFKPPEDKEGEENKDGTVRFAKMSDEEYAKLAKNFPENNSTGKPHHKLHRRSRSKSDKGDSFAPDTVVKSTVLKQVFFEKHTLIAADPKKYQQELLEARGALEPRFLPADVKKKLKKLNIQFLATREQREQRVQRDRSKSSPPMPAPPRSLVLEEILAKEGTTIPRIVRQALDFMSTEEKLNTEGLFRVAGNSYEIDILWESVNEGESITEACDIHTVTSVFKRFFRELKEPLFTFKLHKQFLHAVNDDLTEEESKQKLKETLAMVPAANLIIIRELFDFLNKVIAHSKSNKMHAVNLGIVFGPSLMRDNSSMGAMFDNRNQVVATLLENYSFIFDVPGSPPQ